jgi:hypothetical protein
MRIYEWGAGLPSTQWLAVSAQDIPRLVDGFRGRPMSDGWVPMRARVVERDEDSGARLTPTAFPSLNFSGVALSAAAADRTGSFLREFGELLPLEVTKGEYFAYNVTNLADALDLPRSDVTFFGDGLRIMLIRRHVFLGEVAQRATVFKLPQQPHGAIYLTEDAVERISDGGSLALDARLVWETA